MQIGWQIFTWSIHSYSRRIWGSSHSNRERTAVNVNTTVSNTQSVFARLLRLQIQGKGAILMIVEFAIGSLVCRTHTVQT